MELYARIEQILTQLRFSFSRERPFEWFVLLLWGALLSPQPAAVTSYLNGIGLSEDDYARALYWFYSQAFTIDELCRRWSNWLSGYAQARTLNGQCVYAGDGIKVSKEGRKMPGVKGLHQESEDVSKPEWIRGHYFSALSLLLGTSTALFAAPIAPKLHDGIETGGVDSQLTLVDKIAMMCVNLMTQGSYAVLDAYYASAKVLQPFQAHGLHLISRVSISTVARAPFSANPKVRGPGRLRQWGSRIKLRELFAPLSDCHRAQVWLYGEQQLVYYQQFEFY